MVVNTLQIFDLWLFLGRKKASVVVANAASYTPSMYVRTKHEDSCVNVSIKTACMYVCEIIGDLQVLGLGFNTTNIGTYGKDN